jgi:hypothetical protein
MAFSTSTRILTGRALQFQTGLKIVENHQSYLLQQQHFSAKNGKPLDIGARSIFTSKTIFDSKRFVSRSTSSMHETPQIELAVGATVERPKSKWEEKADLRRKITGSGAIPSVAEVLKDFKYKLVTEVNQDLVDERFRGLPEDQRPVVLLCGWAGATPKNLHKYSEIYQRAGCITLDYNLPSRFVFTETCEVPYIAKELLKVIEAAKLLNKPLFLHLMSDTGELKVFSYYNF